MEKSKSPNKDNKCLVSNIAAGAAIILLLLALTALIVSRLQLNEKEKSSECNSIEETEKQEDLTPETSMNNENSLTEIEYVLFDNDQLQFKLPQSWVATIAEKTIKNKTNEDVQYDYLYPTRIKISNASDNQFVEAIGPQGGHGICAVEIEDDNLNKLYSACDTTGEEGRAVEILKNPVEIKIITIENKGNKIKVIRSLI